MGALGVIVLIAAGVILYGVMIYNGFVSLRAGINAAWSDIDVQLKRRFDLIPALVETVKGYKEYEAGTLEKIVKAREMGRAATSTAEAAAASNMLSGALGSLFALAEAYPDLKANTTFMNLQSELSALEDAIQNARRYYNAIVRDYNAKLESFPDIIIAKKFAFESKDYFELEESESRSVQNMPKIDLT